MTLQEQMVCLALQRYPDIDEQNLRIIPTLSPNVLVMDGKNVEETIMMDWLDASGQPMMGWGPKTNTLIVHRRVMALFRADVESERNE